MKSKFYIIASLLVVLCMLWSCGGSGGSEESSAQNTVAVSFAVSAPNGELNKVISATSTDLLSTAVYQYKATPNWTSEFGTIQGTQADWKDFDKTTGNVGYFAVGSWTFEVRIMDSTKTYTLYQTQKADTANNIAAGVTKYVNTSVTAAAPIEILVYKESDGKGTIAFGGTSTLSAPTCGENEKLIATYGKVGGSAIGQALNLTKGTAAAGFTPFTGSITNVDAGVYWVTVTRNDGTNNIGSSTTMVEIYGGKTETISGTVESGKWINTFFDIKGIKTITGTISTTATLPVVKNAAGDTTVALKLTGEIKENGQKDTTATASMKYYLTVNGNVTDVTSDITTEVYSWDVTDLDPGDYYVGLIVADKDKTISANAATPLTVSIEPAP